MIGWAFETLIASTLLMLVVLAIRAPVARLFGPHVAYALWLLPALRMFLPPLPVAVAPKPIYALPANVEALLAAAAAFRTNAIAPAEASSLDWPMIALCLWGAGSLLFLGWHILSYRHFVRTALDQATQLPRLDRDGVEVCASPAARGPFAAGIFLKTVVLPEDYRRRYERDELRLAIEHEVQHHRRCDMSANFAALIVLALHWWNPIAHFAHRAFRIDQELACDAIVLACATPAERHAYGSALLKSACDRLPVAACALGAGDDLKRRLRMMRVYRWNLARTRVGTAITAGLVGGGLMLSASGGIAAGTSKSVEQKMRTVLTPIVPVKLASMVARLAVPEPPAKIPAVPRAPDAPDVPGAPVAPTAPVAPLAPPAPPGFLSISWTQDAGDNDIVDTAAIDREVQESVREAQLDARDAAREAQIEAAASAREAAAEARAASREAMRSHHVAMVRDCPKGTRVSARADDDGNAVMGCGAMSPEERAKMRRQILVSLEQARRSVAASLSGDWARETREHALAGIDREIARLRSDK